MPVTPLSVSLTTSSPTYTFPAATYAVVNFMGNVPDPVNSQWSATSVVLNSVLNVSGVFVNERSGPWCFNGGDTLSLPAPFGGVTLLPGFFVGINGLTSPTSTRKTPFNAGISGSSYTYTVPAGIVRAVFNAFEVGEIGNATISINGKSIFRFNEAPGFYQTNAGPFMAAAGDIISVTNIVGVPGGPFPITVPGTPSYLEHVCVLSGFLYSS